MKNIVTTAVVLSLALVAPSGAGPFEDGLAAYGRGDHAAATHLWRPLADQRNGLAQHNAGLIYQSGRGVPQDDAAASWYQKAADQPTESARAKTFIIADDNGGELAVYYERYRTAVALGATFRIDGIAAQLALLCSLGLTVCASPSGPRLVSIRFETRGASECKARVTV
jgi:TPR repeat protein